MSELEERTDNRISGLAKSFDTRMSGLAKSLDSQISSLTSSLDIRISGLEKNLDKFIEALHEARVPSPTQSPRGCYACGEMGHFRRDCPRAKTNPLTQRVAPPEGERKVAFMELEEGNFLGSEERAALQPEKYVAKN